MTTLNEKAANAVREALEAMVYLDKHFVSTLAFCKYKEKAFAVTSHSETILNALQRQADLIRVIEMAEEALNDMRLWSTWACEKMDLLSDPPLFPEYNKAQQVLAEIRKLKGE